MVAIKKIFKKKISELESFRTLGHSVRAALPKPEPSPLLSGLYMRVF